MPDRAITVTDGTAGPPRAPLAFGVAAVGAGVLGAIVIPGHEFGLNLLLTWIAVAAAVVAGRPRPMTAESLVLGATSFAFAATAVLRDAGWIVAANMIFAAGLGLLAMTGVTTWTRMINDAILCAFRLFDGFTYALRPLLERVPAARRPLGSATRGGVIGLGLVLVFGSLFFTADRAFARLAQDVVWVDWDLTLFPARALVGLVLMSGVGALVLTGPLVDVHGWTPALIHFFLGDSKFVGIGEQTSRRADRLEWMTPLVVLDLLFAAFVAVQITVLFGGERHVLETAGLTYAEYARSGFLQLCAVGAGTLVVVIGTMHWARRTSKRDDLLLRVLLGLLLVLTMVVLASALKRLDLYEATYGFTRLRVAVHATILWLAGIIVLVGAAGLRLRGKWLPRATIGFTAVALVTFTVINPDGLVARLNIERYEETGKIDVIYLSGLSADAAQKLDGLPQSLRNCALGELDRRLDDEPWLSFNAARNRARTIVDSAEFDPIACF